MKVDLQKLGQKIDVLSKELEILTDDSLNELNSDGYVSKTTATKINVTSKALKNFKYIWGVQNSMHGLENSQKNEEEVDYAKLLEKHKSTSGNIQVYQNGLEYGQ